MQLVLAVGSDDAPAGFRHLVPGAFEVAERFGDHQPGLVAHRPAALAPPDAGGAGQSPRWSSTAIAIGPRSSSGTPQIDVPSVVATVI